MTENGEIVRMVNNNTQQKYAGLQHQHQEFVSHLNNQLQPMQTQLQQLLQQQAAQPPAPSPTQPLGLPGMSPQPEALGPSST